MNNLFEFSVSYLYYFVPHSIPYFDFVMFDGTHFLVLVLTSSQS